MFLWFAWIASFFSVRKDKENHPIVTWKHSQLQIFGKLSVLETVSDSFSSESILRLAECRVLRHCSVLWCFKVHTSCFHSGFNRDDVQLDTGVTCSQEIKLWLTNGVAGFKSVSANTAEPTLTRVLQPETTFYWFHQCLFIIIELKKKTSAASPTWKRLFKSKKSTSKRPTTKCFPIVC